MDISDFGADTWEMLSSPHCADCQRTPRSMNQRSRLSKMRRIREKRPPRVLDLFSGCGGFSLGFVGAGYSVVGAVELDPLAAQSHALNFCKGFTAKQLEMHAKPRDIIRAEPEELVHDLSL